MAKKVVGSLKLQIKAGQANPSPPVGPALGQRGINIMEFCKAFNARTQEMEPGAPTPVVITYYADKSFTFETKTPPCGRPSSGLAKATAWLWSAIAAATPRSWRRSQRRSIPAGASRSGPGCDRAAGTGRGAAPPPRRR